MSLVLLGAVGCGDGCRALERRREQAAPLELGGTDCSDGIARCVEGRVEVSRLAHLSAAACAGGSPERRAACTCPWDPVATCATGCVVEGVVAIADADAGARQLCRSNAPVTRPALPGDPPPRICSVAGVACRDGVVWRCDHAGKPEEAVAVCLRGCDLGIAVDHGETTIANGVAAILCARSSAASD